MLSHRENIKVDEIKTAHFNKNLIAEDSGLANIPIMNPEWHKQPVDLAVFSKSSELVEPFE